MTKECNTNNNTNDKLIKQIEQLVVSKDQRRSKTLEEIPNDAILQKLITQMIQNQDVVNNIVFRIRMESTFTKFREAIKKSIEFEKIYVKHAKDLMNILLTNLYETDNLNVWYRNYISKSKRLVCKKHYLHLKKQQLIKVIEPLMPFIVGDISPFIESEKIFKELYYYIPEFEYATSHLTIKYFQTRVLVFQHQYTEQSSHITVDVQSILDNHHRATKFKVLVDKFHARVFKVVSDVHEIRKLNTKKLVTPRRSWHWSNSNSPYSSPAE